MKQIPKYQLIYDDLLKAIDAGTYHPGEKLPTEKDLAEKYAVSRITTKRAMDTAAINGFITRIPGKGSFVADTPKAQGRMRTESGSGRCLGVILPDLSEFFGLDVLKEIERLANEEDISIILGISNKNLEKEKALIHRLYDFGVDGFIILPVFYENFNEEILKLILKGFPIVLIDRYLRDIACPCVLSGNRQAAMDGMHHLINLGHRNIGCISRPINAGSSLQEREQGIKDSIIEHGLRSSPRWWLTSLEHLDNKDEKTFMNHKEQIKAFLEHNCQLTAIFCLEYSPVPILKTVAKELDIAIPEDLSIISFDSPGHLESHMMDITYLRQNEAAIARRAFSLITSMQQEQPLSHTMNIIDVELVAGNSTAPPREY